MTARRKIVPVGRESAISARIIGALALKVHLSVAADPPAVEAAIVIVGGVAMVVENAVVVAAEGSVRGR